MNKELTVWDIETLNMLICSCGSSKVASKIEKENGKVILTVKCLDCGLSQSKAGEPFYE
jgi:hypothetical protein